MGATSAQGWYLFAFIVGFTLGPAGLFALGWPVALLGFGILAASLVGFRSVKERSEADRAGTQRSAASASVEARSANF